MTQALTASITVAAPPEQVYALVADPASMGELSSETTTVEFLDGATEARPGVRLRGKQQHGFWRWSTVSTILTADPGREISWRSSSMGLPVALWRYTFEADGAGGTSVTESTSDERGALLRAVSPLGTGVRDRATRNRVAIEETLERLKSAVEAMPGPQR